MLLQPCVDWWCRLHSCWLHSCLHDAAVVQCHAAILHNLLTIKPIVTTLWRRMQLYSRSSWAWHTRPGRSRDHRRHLPSHVGAGRRVRQFWPQQEVQVQHLKMIMNLGGFNDSNKVEVWDAIVKRRGHRNLDWFLCFGKIFAFYVCGWCLSCCLMCLACVVLCAFVFRVCVSWLNVSKWNHELWMNVSVVR